jgi:hypothetical protein
MPRYLAFGELLKCYNTIGRNFIAVNPFVD